MPFGGLGMTIESDELANLREITSKTLLAVLWLQVPIAVAIGVMRGTAWIVPAALVAAMALAAMMSWRALGNGLSTRPIFAVAPLCAVWVRAFELAGPPWPNDMHQ